MLNIKQSLFSILFIIKIECIAQLSADSAFIYKNFKESGTTANLFHNHYDLDSIDAPKIRLNYDDLKEIIDLFRPIKEKKYFQQKHGIEIYYLVIYNQGKKSIAAIECTDKSGWFIDLTHKKNWWLIDSNSKKQLNSIIKKYLT